MMKRNLIKILTVALAVGALLVAVPAVTQAANITSVSVTIGAVTWCDTTGSCVVDGATGQGGKIWNLGAGGVDLSGATTVLILTQGQTPTVNGYNFDSSEVTGTFTPTVTINGVTFTDTGKVLDDPSDSTNSLHQEAVDWTNLGITSGIHLWVAYADNAHGGTTGAGSLQCTDANHSCLPESPWQGSPNTLFLGNPISGGCIPPGDLTATINPALSCFDAGALRIELAPTTTPEPTVLLTLGAGLIGIALVARKRAKNKA